ncbi:ER membrane protein [Stagonosporopsis vannaccii]|nr:ER membrane protein [Stagonosporopsis vannaccii]
MASTRPTLSTMIVAIATLLFSVLATAQGTGFTQSYCSSQNTGTGDAFFWTYQTNGKCRDHCAEQGSYAFAVIRFQDCWCSDYIPATTTDMSSCQVDCPGYPSEKCGNEDEGLYIYIELAGQPSGTAGGGSRPSSTEVSSATPVPSSTGSPSSDAANPSSAPPDQRPTSRGRPPVTVTRTVVGDSPVVPVVPTRRTSDIPTSTAPSRSSDRPSSTMRTVVTSSATAMSTSVQVITESGAVVTRTVIYRPTEAASQSQPSDGGSNNTGAIVGGVVGGVAAIAAIVGGIIFFLWRRRKQQREAQEHQAGITRNTSTMSKAGLLGGRTVATDPQHPPPIATSFSNAGSRHDTESISPISGSQRRYSQPMMIDSRLNPETVLMYHPTFGNSSRESLGSIDDSRDYGRQLNVRNPDPH